MDTLTPSSLCINTNENTHDDGVRTHAYTHAHAHIEVQVHSHIRRSTEMLAHMRTSIKTHKKHVHTFIYKLSFSHTHEETRTSPPHTRSPDIK
jgi:hypothetical protein